MTTKARTFLRALARLLEEPTSAEHRSRFDAALNELTAEESGRVALRLDALEPDTLEPRERLLLDCKDMWKDGGRSLNTRQPDTHVDGGKKASEKRAHDDRDDDLEPRERLARATRDLYVTGGRAT